MKNIPLRRIRASRKEPVLGEGFSIRDLEELLAGKDMVQELHRHDFFFILALEKGMGEHVIDFIPYPVGDYSVFFMRPGQVHQLTLKTGCTGYLVQFNADFYFPQDKASSQLLRKVSTKNLCGITPERFEKLRGILAFIAREYAGKQDRYRDVIKANLFVFFIELIRQSKNPQRLSSDDNPYMQERLEDFLDLLETHISTHKQVAQYADLLNLSTYQLNAITKTLLGKTCSEVINEHIVLEAKRQLLATANQVKEIAYSLGYEDASYFIRFFRKHTGHSPEAFRSRFK